ncbi:APC family permease [Ferruginibacter sp. SUN106]|uniref:APC family permease n=1 Tax=Ferruginibacter sp. SUN106 TaxID=2978348 RepID=UPI003D35EBDA
MTAKTNKLNLFDFTMIVVSLVIGMGIFRTPANVAKASPDTFLFFAAWIAGGVVALCGALTYAEIGSRLPVTGGYYKVFSYAYHPSVAFAINCVILVSNAASLAAVALVGGEYITGIFIPLSKDAEWIKVAANANYIQTIHIVIAIAAIIIFYGVNLAGLKMSAKTQNVLTVIKIILILLLITPLFFADNSAVLNQVKAATISPTFREYIKAFGIGLVAVSFTYGGYQQTINFGAEVDKAAKNVPRGIFFGIAIIVTLYLTINYAYIKVIGFDTLHQPETKNIAAIMASKIFGVNAERVLSGFLFLSVLAYVNVLLMSNPRVMYAMSEDNILPPVFKKRNPKTDVLTVSLSVFAAICIIIIFWAKEFDKILSFTIFLDCFGMILSAATIFILRKKTKHLDDTGIYKMKLFPVLPLIFIAAYVFVAISIALEPTKPGETNAAVTGLIVMAVFTGLYFLLAQLKKNKN